MKKLSLVLLLLVYGFFPSAEVLASFSKSVVETEIEAGSGQIYQYVETTVNGETVIKESFEPGKLELKMEKIGESEPTVTFSQEEIFPSQLLTPTPTFKTETSPVSFIVPIIEFFRKLFSHLTAWFK